MIDKAVGEARKSANANVLFLITTNDNLNALGFYQKRGFEMVTIYRGAVNRIKEDQTEYSVDRIEQYSPAG